MQREHTNGRSLKRLLIGNRAFYAMVLAIVSSARDQVISYDTTAIGEVGLTGEIRSVNALNQRLTEVARLGFKRCVIPAHVRGEVKAPEGLELISVRNIREAIDTVI